MSTHCQQFQDTYAKLGQGIEPIEALLTKFTQNPSADLSTQFKDALKQFSQNKKDITQDFENAVRQLLIQWFPVQSNQDRLMFEQAISFDENQRVVIDGDLALYGGTTPFTHIPKMIRSVKETLELKDAAITSLDGIEEVGGTLSLHRLPSLTSMKNLRHVGGYLGISNLPSLYSLDSLETVGNIDLKDPNQPRQPQEGNLPLASLPKLRHVRESADFSDTSITNVDSLTEVGDILTWGEQIRSFPKLQKVGTVGFGSQTARHFREIFPVLRDVGISYYSLSFMDVPPDMETEIRQEQQNGNLRFQGLIHLKRIR